MKMFGDDEFRPISVSPDELIGAIHAEAALAPETVYAAPAHMQQTEDNVSCFYVHTYADTGRPFECGCLIGRALHRLGVPMDELAKHEGKTATQIFPKVLRMDYGSPRSIDEARGFAADVQSKQDRGVPWGEAVQCSADYRGIAL